MRALVRLLADHRDYRLLVGAGLVSMLGDWVLGIGLTFLVYHLTGSTVASGAMLLCSYLPSILLGSVAGVLVDRWDRRTTMIVANLLQVICLAPLVLVQDESRIWIVYVVGAVTACVEQFFMPAEQAMVPNLVPESELVGANGVNSQVRDLARLVGSCVGGVAAGLGGVTALAAIDAVSFVLAAVLLSRIRFRPAPRVSEDATPGVGAAPHALATIMGEWRSGLRTAVGSRALVVVLVFCAVTAMGEGIMGTLFAPFVQDVLHGSGGDYGLIVGVQAIGGVIGGLYVTSAGHRWSALTLFGVGAIVFGLLDLALFLYPLVLDGVAPAVVLMILVGIPGACAIAGLMTTFQTETVDQFRGRVFGAITAVRGVSVLIGVALASWLGDAVGILPIIAIQGAGYVVGGALVLLLLRSSTAAHVHVPDPTHDDGPLSQPGDLAATGLAEEHGVPTGEVAAG